LRTTSFQAWIRDSIKDNKPYQRFAREILTARGDIVGANAQAPVAWYTFLLKPEHLADDTAQVFLGTQLQCAQCHHHPYEKWSQEDYWGFAAFFSRLKWQRAGGKPGNIASGSPWSVSIDLTPTGRVQSPKPHNKTYSNPRTLDGVELTIPKGEDPREKLADSLVQNPTFAVALVNRYWAHFLGRGIVDPVDDLRATNPPTNPELLDALARDFVAHKFDLKHLIRVICTSKTYQLTSVANTLNKDDVQNYSRHIPRRLQAEVLLDAIDQVNATTTQFELGLIRKNILGDQEYQKYDNMRGKLRAIELPDETLFCTLFLTTFEKPSRETACECERAGTPALKHTLYLLNAKEVQDKLMAKGARAERLTSDSRDDPAKIRELYLWCYGRQPSAEELQLVTKYLARHPATTKRQAYEDILWAMINTKEFQFNH
jgi:hypothetical protein